MDNSKYLSVSALTKYIKRKFDVDPYLGRIYLTGEISNFRLRSNAHQYFSLKDEHAKISAIMFKSAFQKVKFTPEDGMKVLVSGRIGLYEASGSYQIYVDSMQPDGVGALYQAYEQLKNKLAQEGLFDAFKKPLVKFPKKIAVVTSPSGAVIRDIITTTQRRFPIAQIVLFPALVQGDAAAKDIVRQIERANADGTFDTLIIGRGGGAIEDLWPFNEEIVARAIATSNLPVISSVGHETDTTIADLVADVRAATPTAAAELAVPVLTDEVIKLINQRQRLVAATRSLIKLNQQRLKRLQQNYIFQQPNRLYDGYSQNVDLLRQRLARQAATQFGQWQQQVLATKNRLSVQALSQQISRAQQVEETLHARLERAMRQFMVDQHKEFSSTVESLNFLSPLKIMSRGYTYVTAHDHVVKNTIDLTTGESIDLHFTDGQARAKITEIKKG